MTIDNIFLEMVQWWEGCTEHGFDRVVSLLDLCILDGLCFFLFMEDFI